MQKVITNASDLAAVLLGGAEVKFLNDKLIVVELSPEQEAKEHERAERAKNAALEEVALALRDEARKAYKAMLQQAERVKALNAARQIPVSRLNCAKVMNQWMASRGITDIAQLLSRTADELPAKQSGVIRSKLSEVLPLDKYPGAVWSNQIHFIQVEVPQIVDVEQLDGLSQAKLELQYLVYNKSSFADLGPQAFDESLRRILRILHKDRIANRASQVATVAFTPKGREAEGALHLDVYYDHFADNYFGVDGALLPDSEGLVYSPYNLDFPLQVSDGSEAPVISGSVKSPESAPAQ